MLNGVQEATVVESEGEAPLHAVMSQLGIELWNLSDGLGGIERAVHRMIAGSGRLELSDMGDLQAIDLIQQSLQALAEFSLGIAALIPPGMNIDVQSQSRLVKLQGLADRLALKSVSPEADPDGIIFD